MSSLVADKAIPNIEPVRHNRIPKKIIKYRLPTMTTSSVRNTTIIISTKDIVTTMNDNIICVNRISADLTPASKVRFHTPSIRL